MGRTIDVITATQRGYNIKKVGEKMYINEMNKFDDAFPNGVFAIPRDPKDPRVKVRALWDYCKEKGVEPEDLSKEEMEQFLVYPK